MTIAQIAAIISLLISFGVTPTEAQNVQTILENSKPVQEKVVSIPVPVVIATTTPVQGVITESPKEKPAEWSPAPEKKVNKACQIHGCITKSGQIVK